MDQIRIGTVGYGNLGRGVEYALRQNPDVALVGVFTRRPSFSLTLQTPGVPVYPLDALNEIGDAVDVLLLCGGNAADLPEQSPRYAGCFHLVDNFDTHANIPAHFAAVDVAARAGGKTAIISAGWDLGFFSLIRALAAAVLPCGGSYTFWGRGVSQGHSDAVRRIPGVRDARQHTVPVPAALGAVRNGANPALTTRQKHIRGCFMVAEEGADRARIEQAIITMPHYSADYDITVRFLSEEELLRDHGGLSHDGFVFRDGRTGRQEQNRILVGLRLTLDPNPEFTAYVLTALARAAFRLGRAGQASCKIVFDIPPAALSPLSPEELRRQLLQGAFQRTRLRNAFPAR